MKVTALLIFIFITNTYGWFYGRPDPGASTTGGVWPLPVKSYDYNTTVLIDPSSFTFTTSLTCNTIQKAIKRYKKWTFPVYTNMSNAMSSNGNTLTSMNIQVDTSCNDKEYPYFNMDESYQVIVPQIGGKGFIIAKTMWGAIRGMETFSQLVYRTSETTYQVRSVSITDHPRFAYRGVLVDTTRHWVSVNVLKQVLDLMSQNKFNVFHWHLVDSESFPYVSTKFPNLHKAGAYSPRHIYTPGDVKKIIEHARLRGIRVIPEFDTPGHTGAWNGQKNLLSKCYDRDGNNDILGNILDPTLPENMQFIKEFFEEALSVFPDNSMHFGGDEVSSYILECWTRNADVISRMKNMGFGDDTTQLLQYYFQQLVNYVQNTRNGTQMIFWQEVLDMGVAPSNSVAHVWKGGNIDEVNQEIAQVTLNGHLAIVSSFWYLNYIKYGNDWGYLDSDNMRLRGLYYESDPQGFTGTQEQKDLVIGGEAIMWGEFVDGTNLVSRLFPRASAVAERLWSVASMTKSADAAWPRLHEHRCRMMNRKFNVEPPNNPDYCPYEWNISYDNVDE
uniref:Beta-hexosaminidase n=1 Tax=Strongyloides venezuelensis TaxID=75913 RepID=A0A0K0FLL0_STRVS